MGLGKYIADPRQSPSDLLSDPLGTPLTSLEKAKRKNNKSGKSATDSASLARKKMLNANLGNALAAGDVFTYNAFLKKYRKREGELPNEVPDDKSLRLKSRQAGSKQSSRDRNKLSKRVRELKGVGDVKTRPKIVPVKPPGPPDPGLDDYREHLQMYQANMMTPLQLAARNRPTSVGSRRAPFNRYNGSNNPGGMSRPRRS